MYSKWEDRDKKIYWFGLLSIVEENPMVKLSWENWKIGGCFKKMEQLFQGRKKSKQIKSFDQRMKKQFLQKHKIDVMEAICPALRKFELTQEQTRRLANFEKLFIREENKRSFEDIFN